VNIFKPLMLVAGLSGGVMGAVIGSELGVAETVVGGGVGALFGLTVGGVVLCLVLLGARLMGPLVQRSLLRPIFGAYWRRRDLWRSVVDRFEPGARVRGEVVLRRPWGVVIDVGCGFPAVLKRNDMAESRRGRGMEGYPALGETVEARILEHASRWNEIVLTEEPPPPSVLAAEAPVVATTRSDVRVRSRANER
jgi:hypothetical protein